MNLKEIRWKQRFENFERSYKLLDKYSKQDIKNELERAGLIKLYEITVELSWNLLKDYLEAQGFIVHSPRETIKQAFQMGIIENGHVWIDALSSRDLTVHTYDEKYAEHMGNEIKSAYLPELTKLYEKLLREV